MGILALILVALIGAALAGVGVYFWPQLMSWSREHLLPWVDKNAPQLAEAVRLAFQDLDKVAVELRRAVRVAWRNLRKVLLSQTATFVELGNGEWAVRITSLLQKLEEQGRPVVRLVTEQYVAWEELPEEIRAAAMSNGLDGQSIDILRARDQLLEQTV